MMAHLEYWYGPLSSLASVKYDDKYKKKRL